MFGLTQATKNVVKRYPNKLQFYLQQMMNNKCCCCNCRADDTPYRQEILLGAIIVNLEQLQDKLNAIKTEVNAIKQQNVDLVAQVASLQNPELPASIEAMVTDIESVLNQ